MKPLIKKVWGDTSSFLHNKGRIRWVDLLVFVGLIGILSGVISVAKEWGGAAHPTVEIDLSLSALPKYVFFSLSRGLIAYLFSLIFTLFYGYWAYRDPMAEKVLIPVLDILQSVPVLGFMPGLVLALVALFPTSNVGLELASIIMIFTGQVWNMTFSFFHSLRSIPLEQREASSVYHFNWWERFKWVELPFSVIGLVWNSMMSMAGGWFFLMISEAFVLGNKDFRLPGLGSYMSVAVAHGDVHAIFAAIVAMGLMIVALDQLLWRPIVVWAQKFRVEEEAQQVIMSSHILDWLRRSRLIGWGVRSFRQLKKNGVPRRKKTLPAETAVLVSSKWGEWISRIFFIALMVALGLLSWKMIHLLTHVGLAQWGSILAAAVLTLGRVLLSTALGTVWALPAGLFIGLSPRLSRVLHPIVQIVTSFPAPMLFPIVIALLKLTGIPLGWGSILLMMLGTQGYVLFNVIAGAMALPADLQEVAENYRITGWQRFWKVYFPGVFPYLVTGWVTATGGAWNASIVAEFVTFKGEVITCHGLGAMISKSAEQGNFPMLAANILVMAAVVVAFNRTIWRRFYRLAEKRFSLSK